MTCIYFNALLTQELASYLIIAHSLHLKPKRWIQALKWTATAYVDVVHSDTF